MIGAILTLSGVATMARAQDSGPVCEWRVDGFEEQDGRIVLDGATAVCGQLTVQVESAELGLTEAVGRGDPAIVRSLDLVLSSREVHLEGQHVRADEGCVTVAGDNGLTCCGRDLDLTMHGEWSMRSATCTVNPGISYHGASVRGTAEGIRLTSASIIEPLDLRYWLDTLDPAGRAAGFTLPALGFHSDRGVGLRQDWFTPLGPAADVTAGAFVETGGAVGLVSTLWLAIHHRRPGRLSWTGLYDSSTEQEWRSAIRADLTWESQSGWRGVTAVGDLWTDNALGRDFARSTLARERRDRHIALAGWTGSSVDRLWIGLRSTGSGTAFEGTADTPDISFYSQLPALGYAGNLSLGRLGQLTSQLSVSRVDASTSQTPARRYSLDLLTGGHLFALSIPGLSILPAVWLDADSEFTDPGADELYHEYGIRLVTGAEMSSPWLGHRRSVGHYIELSGSVRFELFRASRTTGVQDPAFDAPTSQGPYLAQVRLGQVLSTPFGRIDLPISWQAQWGEGDERHHVMAATELNLPLDGFGLRLGQTTVLDTRSIEVPFFAGSLEVGLGSDQLPFDRTGRLPAQAHPVVLGGAVMLVRSPFVLSDIFGVSSFGHTRRAHQGQWSDDVDAVSAWARVKEGLVGMSSYIVWPVDVGDDPDLGGRIWLGELDDFHIAISGDLLQDGTFIILGSLAQGVVAPGGPWSLTDPGLSDLFP